MEAQVAYEATIRAVTAAAIGSECGPVVDVALAQAHATNRSAGGWAWGAHL